MYASCDCPVQNFTHEGTLDAGSCCSAGPAARAACSTFSGRFTIKHTFTISSLALTNCLIAFLLSCLPMAGAMQLYSRAASSCSFRVRIGLNLKQLQYEMIPMKAVDQGQDPFRSLNPQRLVPLLAHKGDGIGQSMAILEYLEEMFGSSGAPLLPDDPSGRARVRAISQYVCAEIQPLQNTRLDAYLHQLVSADYLFA